MAIEPKSETIGEFTYIVAPLTAKKGAKALTRLLSAGDVNEWKDEDADYFRELFAANTFVTGGSYGEKELPLPSVFELHFVERYFDYFKWLEFCIKANFGSFFEKAKSEAEKKRRATSASE